MPINYTLFQKNEKNVRIIEKKNQKVNYIKSKNRKKQFCILQLLKVKLFSIKKAEIKKKNQYSKKN